MVETFLIDNPKAISKLRFDVCCLILSDENQGENHDDSHSEDD